MLGGGLAVDHVHMLVSIPPKYAVAQVIGFVKTKKPSESTFETKKKPIRSWSR